MTNEEFLALPHPRKSRRVAEFVFGWDVQDDGVTCDMGDAQCYLPHFATHLPDAWKIALHLGNVTLQYGKYTHSCTVRSAGRSYYAYHSIPEIAICMAALKSVGALENGSRYFTSD